MRSLIQQYYRSEYNHYQEENAFDENVLRFGEDQGVSDLPSFNDETSADTNRSPVNASGHDDVIYRETSSNDYYPAASDTTAHTILSQSDHDDTDPRNDSYLVPIKSANQKRTIAGKVADEIVPLVEQNSALPRATVETHPSQAGIKGRAPFRPAPPPPSKATKPNLDSYVWERIEIYICRS